MKLKQILFIFVVSLSFVSYGQNEGLNDKIQDTFFGVKFGASKYDVIKSFALHNLYVDNENNSDNIVTFIKKDSKYGAKNYSISFGGFDWDRINLGLVNNKFAYITFACIFLDKEYGLNLFESLLLTIARKYSIKQVMPNVTDGFLYRYEGYSKDFKCISIDFIQVNTNVYFTTITYQDFKFLNVSNDL